MPLLLVIALQHIYQACCRAAVGARNDMEWHIKSADSNVWQWYVQLVAHTLEGSQVMVIMEYV